MAAASSGRRSRISLSGSFADVSAKVDAVCPPVGCVGITAPGANRVQKHPDVFKARPRHPATAPPSTALRTQHGPSLPTLGHPALTAAPRARHAGGRQHPRAKGDRAAAEFPHVHNRLVAGVDAGGALHACSASESLEQRRSRSPHVGRLRDILSPTRSSIFRGRNRQSEHGDADGQRRLRRCQRVSLNRTNRAGTRALCMTSGRFLRARS